MTTAIQIPTLLRIKPNTLYKLGKYLRRNGFDRIALFYGEGMADLLGQTVEISLDSSEIRTTSTHTVTGNDIEDVVTSAFGLSRSTDAIVAVGGGMAIDYAKYAGFLADRPVIAVPTALVLSGVSGRDTVEHFPYRPDFIFDSVGHLDWDALTASTEDGDDAERAG